MRILHTADWHLGRVFHGIQLVNDQAYLLEQLIQLIKEEDIDILLVSGDVYDRSIPPAEAVILLDDFLTKLSMDANIPVALIAGNHDSAERLAFGHRLMAGQNIFITGQLSSSMAPIAISDKYGPVNFCPIPFAEPVKVREMTGDQRAVNYNAAMGCLTAAALAAVPTGARTVALAHAFVAGCEETESERPISVGGAGNISKSCFEGFDYVALGHLHRPQTAGSDKIHYSGSLMKYSFNEADHQKAVKVIDIDGKGQTSVSSISLTAKHDVRRIKGNLTEVLVNGEKDGHSSDYIMVTLTDHGALLDPMGKLRQVYPNVLHLERPYITAAAGMTGPGRNYKNKNIVDLFADFYDQVTETDLNKQQRDMFSELLDDMDVEGWGELL